MDRARTYAAAALVGGCAAVVAVALPVGAAEGPDQFLPVMDEAWQLDFGAGAAYQYASPVAADVDGDGIAEVVVAGQDGILRVIGADGGVRWERAVVPPGAGGPVAVDATPTVADLDGDGRPEIVVGAGSFERRGQSGGLVVFDAGGSVRWSWAGVDVFNFWTSANGGDGYREPVVGTPAIADVNGDGRRDVVFGAMDNRVHVLDGPSGQEIGGWSGPGRGEPAGAGYWVDDAIWGSVATADVDGDGRDEVFVGVAATPGGTLSHAGGALMRLDLEGGGVDQRWTRYYGAPVNASPALADLDGDGELELVSGMAFDPGNPAANLVVAVDAGTGADAPGWPQVTNGATVASPAVGDLDGDARPEVVIATFPGGGDGLVYAYRGDGSQLWVRPPNEAGYGEPGSVIAASPVLADVNGDGRTDVTVGHGWAMFSLDGPTGGRFFAAVDKGNSFQNAPTVADFGPYGWMLVNASMSGSVAAYRIPSPRAAAGWPTWRGANVHTGLASPLAPPECAAPSGGSPPAGTPGGATFHPVAPTRVFDTRDGFGLARRGVVRPGCPLAVRVAGIGGVPADAEAVVLNVTASQASAPGYLTVYPCGSFPPNASNVNYVAGQIVPNAVKVPLGAGGQVCISTYAAVDVLADVSGWYGGTDGAGFSPLTPARVLDTRDGLGVAGGGAGEVGVDGVVELAIAGAGGVPEGGVSAVALNVTVTEPDGPGFLTAFPCGGRPNASNLNFVAGQDVPNHVIVPVTADGRVCFSPGNSATHVIVDVSGWYGTPGDGQGARFVPLAPDRILDSRDGTGLGVPTRLGAGGELAFGVLGRAGVPGGGVSAVTLNLTATNPAGAGYVTAYPCGQPAPYASTLNYAAGASVPNLVTVPVGANGQVCFTAYTDVDLVADVAGFFPA